MAIEDRLRTEIILISPQSDGEIEYVGKWIGDPITKEKKLGRFDSPKIKGTIVQDLEVRGDTYQFTFFFDGEDHDEDSAEFWESLDAKGSWTIIHPVNGVVDTLYLSRAVWENEPVRSVGFTTFNTNWIQSLPDATTISIAELEGVLINDADLLDATALAQFEADVKTDNFEQFKALASAVEKAVAEIQSKLRAFENLQIINPRLEALFRGITATLESFPPDTAALGAQFNGLFEAIGLAQNSALGAVDNMNNIISAQTNIETDDAGVNGRNAAAVAELNASLANSQIAKAALLPGIETREQAIDLATLINDYLNNIIARFDAVGQNFLDTPIEDQYVPFSAGLGDLVKANRRAIQFLLSTALDLKVERVFTTRAPRSPIEIAWTELGGPGEIIEEDNIKIDRNFADFCRWNNLHGNNILWLPADSEVRIFA
jgi:hypothetical protein